MSQLPQQDHEARPQGEQLLERHHQAGGALIGEWREPEQPGGPVGVGRVVGVEREHQGVREHLAGKKTATVNASRPRSPNRPRPAGSIIWIQISSPEQYVG